MFLLVQEAREPVPEPTTAGLASLGIVAWADIVCRTRLNRVARA
jgi:hypothetical protein